MNAVLTNHAAIDSISRRFESSVFGVNDNDTDDISASIYDTDGSVRVVVNALCQHSLRYSSERNPDCSDTSLFFLHSRMFYSKTL